MTLATANARCRNPFAQHTEIVRMVVWTDATMLRTVLTFTLAIGALALAVTPRGLALLGSNRAAFVIALAVLAILQGYRLISAWQARKRDDRLKNIPKRPLGI